MAKLERGRLDGVWGMQKFTADELRAMADQFETQMGLAGNKDDPRWLRRWAEKLRRLAAAKEKSHQHKERHKQPKTRESNTTQPQIPPSAEQLDG